jgi:hypothetical protein
MTIVVGVAAPDGLVLAADSRTTLMLSGGRTRVASDTAQKVFPLCGRFGVACYGAAFVDEKTIGGQMNEFQASLDEPPRDVDELVGHLGAFFQERLLKALANGGEPWKPSDGWHLGFLVAGYDPQGLGHLYDVRVPGDGDPEIISTPASTANVGVAPRGLDDVINRLLAGIDSNGLASSGVSVPDEVEQALAGLEYNLLLPITMQDAIDCAAFLIRTTIDMQRFSDGTGAKPGSIPGCGGPVRILAVGRNEIEWISRPALTAGTPPGNAEGAIA